MQLKKYENHIHLAWYLSKSFQIHVLFAALRLDVRLTNIRELDPQLSLSKQTVGRTLGPVEVGSFSLLFCGFL